MILDQDMATSTRRLRSAMKKGQEVQSDQTKRAEEPKTSEKAIVQEPSPPQVVEENKASSPKFVLDESESEVENETQPKPVDTSVAKQSDDEAATQPKHIPNYKG